MKAAVCLYDGFCNFEFSVLLESLVLADCQIDYIAKTLKPVRAEEGFLALGEYTWGTICADDYDVLVLTGIGAEDDSSDWILADEELLSLIRSFDKAGKLIAAISCAPMILVNAGIMNERRYVASVDRECFMAGGACTSVELSAEQMKGLLDMKEQKKHPELHGYVQDGNVITANGWWFREWAMAVCKALQLPFYPKSFGLETEEAEEE